MTHMQALLAGWATALGGVAVLAGWRERQRRVRTRPDAVGLIAWPTVQLLAFVGLAMCGLLALSG